MKETQSTNETLMIIFWNLGIGGVQRKIMDIIKYVESEGKYRKVRLHLIIRDRTPFSLDESKTYSRTQVHYFPESIKTTSRFLFPLFVLWKIVIIKPKSILTFFNMASVYTIAATRLLFWRNIKVILNEDILTSRDVTSRARRMLIKFFYPLAHRIISPTVTLKNDLVKNFGIDQAKIIVIPNWTTVKKGKSRLHKKFDLLFIGRFTKQKNIPFLLRAIKKMQKKNINV